MLSLALGRANCFALITFAWLSPILPGCSSSSGNLNGTGGSTEAGAGVGSGGASNGGSSTAGTTSGTTNTGGNGVSNTAATGGTATGGTATGGAATGGRTATAPNTGGAATGGQTGTAPNTGGVSSGGQTATSPNTGGATTAGASAGGGASSLPRLTVTGNKLTDPNGKTIILRGSSLIDIGSLYAFYGKNTAAITNRMDKIAAAGVQGHVVRLPVYPKIDYNTGGDPACSPYPYPVGTGPSASCTPTSPVTADQYYSNILKPAVDYATSKNLYVIIDFHQIDNMTTGTGSTASTSAADAKTFWTDIAPKFANYTNVFYEIFNEPIDYQKTWATIKPVVQDIITTVRTAAPQNVTIVPNNTWDQKPGDAASDPPSGGNLMYTAHIYASNWTATGAFQTQVTTACSKAPVFITEWGYANSDTNYQTFATTLQAAVDGEGASFTAWVTDNAWTPSMFTDTTFTTLTTFGTQVKTWLAAKVTSDWVY